MEGEATLKQPHSSANHPCYSTFTKSAKNRKMWETQSQKSSKMLAYLQEDSQQSSPKYANEVNYFEECNDKDESPVS